MGNTPDILKWRFVTGSDNSFSFRCQSYQFPDISDAVDLARLRMMRVKKEKQEYWAQVEQCRADGSCPDMSFLRSGGPAECVHGEYDQRVLLAKWRPAECS